MIYLVIVEALIIVTLVFELFKKSRQVGQSYVQFKIEEAKNIKLHAENEDLLEKVYNLQETVKKISEETNKKTVKTTRTRKTKKKEEGK